MSEDSNSTNAIASNAHCGNAHNRAAHLSASERSLLASKLKIQHDEIVLQLYALDQQTRTPDGSDAAQADAAQADAAQADGAQADGAQADAAQADAAQADAAQADAAQADAAHEVDAKLAEIEQFELNQINQALLRVVGQDYGVCVNCGAEIRLTRLQAKPQASRCLECQAQLERRPSVQP